MWEKIENLLFSTCRVCDVLFWMTIGFLLGSLIVLIILFVGLRNELF